MNRFKRMERAEEEGGKEDTVTHRGRSDRERVLSTQLHKETRRPVSVRAVRHGKMQRVSSPAECAREQRRSQKGLVMI